jgi:S1-C subfamily serine protease
MSKYIVAGILLFAALSSQAAVYENKSGTVFSDTPTPGAQPVDIPDNASNSMPATPALNALKVPAGKSKTIYHIISGTGFFVTKSYVVTNAHVLKGGCDKIVIKGAVPERTVTLKVLDTEHDLALLETSHPPQQYAPLRFNLDDLKIGDKVYILGFPGVEGIHGEYHFAQAQILDLGSRSHRERFYITDVLLHGNSGGPVLDKNGNVIGVVVATSTFSKGDKKVDVGVVISLTTLKEFLTANSIFADWITSHLSYDEDYIEDNAKDYIVAVQCRTMNK